MKKFTVLSLILVLSLVIFVGCTGKTSDSSDLIKIGASPAPHSQILEAIKPILEKDGIKLEIVEFTDYIQPNIALADGSIDANFFQHKPYFDNFIKEENLDLLALGQVHVEPMALYSNNYSSIDEIPTGAELAIPNDDVNGRRALLLLEANGLITIDPNAGAGATERDIIDNPRELKIKALEAALIPRVLEDLDGAVINGNYALEAGLNPVKDGLIIEDKESEFGNIIAIRREDESKDKFKKLMEALQSDEIRRFLEEEYDGAIVPAF